MIIWQYVISYNMCPVQRQKYLFFTFIILINTYNNYKSMTTEQTPSTSEGQEIRLKTQHVFMRFEHINSFKPACDWFVHVYKQ